MNGPKVVLCWSTFPHSDHTELCCIQNNLLFFLQKLVETLIQIFRCKHTPSVCCWYIQTEDWLVKRVRSVWWGGVEAFVYFSNVGYHFMRNGRCERCDWGSRCCWGDAMPLFCAPVLCRYWCLSDISALHAVHSRSFTSLTSFCALEALPAGHAGQKASRALFQFENPEPLWAFFCVQTTWKARFLSPFISVICYIFKLQTDALLS